jgi:uncharacterized phage infection (PIP) family protein YhgE
MRSAVPTLVRSLASLGANGLTALSILSAWVAYGSGDVSGLQYMFLYFGVFFAVAALAATATLVMVKIVPSGNLLPPPFAVLLNLLPQITGVGYNGSVIDQPGRIAAVVLMVLQVLMTAYALWWFWRRAAEPSAAAGGTPK